jgi:CheY-like chemotaxis protein
LATFETVHHAEPVESAETTGLPPEERPATAGTEIERPGAKAKILVADDNEMNVMALDDYLTAAGYELYFAADGEQAVARAEEVVPDLILMDIQMPNVSGVEATKRLRSNPRFADTPILAITALAMPGDRELCLAAGANAYIAKPFLLKELAKAIREWLPRE